MKKITLLLLLLFLSCNSLDIFTINHDVNHLLKILDDVKSTTLFRNQNIKSQIDELLDILESIKDQKRIITVKRIQAWFQQQKAAKIAMQTDDNFDDDDFDNDFDDDKYTEENPLQQLSDGAKQRAAQARAAAADQAAAERAATARARAEAQSRKRREVSARANKDTEDALDAKEQALESRKKLAATEKKLLQIASEQKRLDAEKKINAETSAATKIQARFRGQQAKAKYDLTKAIEAQGRSDREKTKQFMAQQESRINDSIFSQTNLDEAKKLLESKKSPQTNHQAATKIQARFRGRQAQKAAAAERAAAEQPTASTALTTTTPQNTAQSRSEALNVLGLQPGASKRDIERAFRTLARQHHPDKRGNKNLFQLMNSARDLLLNKNTSSTDRLAIEDKDKPASIEISNSSTRSNPFSQLNVDALQDEPVETFNQKVQIGRPVSGNSGQHAKQKPKPTSISSLETIKEEDEEDDDDNNDEDDDAQQALAKAAADEKTEFKYDQQIKEYKTTTAGKRAAANAKKAAQARVEKAKERKAAADKAAADKAAADKAAAERAAAERAAADKAAAERAAATKIQTHVRGRQARKASAADKAAAEQAQAAEQPTASTALTTITPQNTAQSRSEALNVLGLQPGASDPEIERTFRKLSLQNHPDKGGNKNLFQLHNSARDLLLNKNTSSTDRLAIENKPASEDKSANIEISNSSTRSNSFPQLNVDTRQDEPVQTFNQKVQIGRPVSGNLGQHEKQLQVNPFLKAAADKAAADKKSKEALELLRLSGLDEILQQARKATAADKAAAERAAAERAAAERAAADKAKPVDAADALKRLGLSRLNQIPQLRRAQSATPTQKKLTTTQPQQQNQRRQNPFDTDM